MNRFLILFLFLLPLFACNNDVATSSGNSEKAGKYSPEINKALDSTLENYYALSEILVNWDSTAAGGALIKLQASLENLFARMDTISNLEKGKEYLTQAKVSAKEMIAAIDLNAKRHGFHTLSENLFNFLETIQYDRNEVYLQECTMPFNDTGRGVWLSETQEKRNPYLGLYHPYYKAGMLECGTLEGKIDFTSK